MSGKVIFIIGTVKKSKCKVGMSDNLYPGNNQVIKVLAGLVKLSTSLEYYNVINQEILYFPSYRSEVNCIVSILLINS